MSITGDEMVAISGLTLTLVGSALLFVYGYPKRQIGNVLILGDTAVQVDGLPSAEDEPLLWQTKATAFLRRARLFNKTGFALIAAGTICQIAALVLS